MSGRTPTTDEVTPQNAFEKVLFKNSQTFRETTQTKIKTSRGQYNNDVELDENPSNYIYENQIPQKSQSLVINIKSQNHPEQLQSYDINQGHKEEIPRFHNMDRSNHIENSTFSTYKLKHHDEAEHLHLKKSASMDQQPVDQIAHRNTNLALQLKQSNSSPAMESFRKIKNVIIGINRFQKKEVEKISNENELENHFQTTINIEDNEEVKQPRENKSGLNKYPSIFTQKVSSIRNFEKLSSYAAFGTKQELLEMREIIKNDTRLAPNDPEYFLNVRNSKGDTLLHIAAVNGHLPAVKILFQFHAHPLIQAKIGESIFENPFEGAMRWGHNDVLEWMLINYQLSQQQVIELSKSAKTKDQLQIFSQYIQKKKKKGFLCC